MSKIRKSVAALALALTVAFGAQVAAPAAPAQAATLVGVPDAWMYCYYTVPYSPTTKVSYAGIYGKPYQNSVGTMCRDLVQNSWFFWYRARPINDWNYACRLGTNGMFNRAYISNNRYYCR